ncbi:hypothetical protein SLW70_15535 [Flavobacterium sp. NG2]|uniref:hypothetical protein n=1 Tax=Flavobacterium sp. NG2 TaxID=3097547 RepID=UPI002A839366|nr:hypothetical protein [Flavobacterium sp. NG2]WPR71325.1 hypothetical protein SLW70_15535 [Flavobacterium sp. NG2]
MRKNTLEDYKKRIKAKYEIAIQEDSSVLLNTPAVMRDLCLSMCNEGLSVHDEKIFRTFFELNQTEDLRKGIVNCNIALFRPIRSFLKSEKNTENLMRIEVAAILVDFQPRPYSKFYKINSSKEEEVSDTSLSKISIETKKVEVISNDVLTKTLPAFVQKFNFMAKLGWIAGGVVMLSVLGYFIKTNFYPKKQCMEWVGTHYEEVDCDKDKLGFLASSAIVPINENAKELRKLDCNQKLVFFKNEKPLIWYCKYDGEVELYDRPGFHPITGKPLKPITNYMINKYNLSSK